MGDARFLAVDDDHLVLRSLARHLRSMGEVAGVGSLAEARARLAANVQWTGIILDRLLPDGSGLHLLPEIRMRRPHVAILVMTGNVDADAANATYDHRAELVAKPCNCARIRRFAAEATSISARVYDLVQDWATRYQLSPALADLLRRLALGEERADIAVSRGTSELTIQTQISGLLLRTGDRLVHEAVARFLRELARS